MPYNIPTNPYLQGTVLNTDRFTNYYLQQQAHQKAKEEAFDRYNQDLAKNLTPAGMRTKDVEGFTKKVMQWQDFNIKNREAINNPAIDGGRARSTANAMYQDALGDTVKSKAQVADDKLWGGAKTNPNIFDRITPEAMQKKALSEYSIYDKRYTPSSFNNDLQLDAAPFDLKKQEELDKIALSNLPLSEQEKFLKISERDPLMDVMQVTKSLSPENAKKAAEAYRDAYRNDATVQRGMRDIANRIVPRKNMVGQLEIPQELQRFSNLYEQYYPNDHFLNSNGTIDNEKLAIAYGLSRLPAAGVYEKEVPNTTRKAKADAARERENLQFKKSLDFQLEKDKAKLKNNEIQTLDIYNPMLQVASQPNYTGYNKDIPMYALPSTAMDAVLNMAQRKIGNKTMILKDAAGNDVEVQMPVTSKNIMLRLDPSSKNFKMYFVTPNNVEYKDKDGKTIKKGVSQRVDTYIGELDKESLNLEASKGQKERQEVLGQPTNTRISNNKKAIPNF